MEDVLKGVYQHFKGNYYLVEGVAIHTETLGELVVYRALYGDRKLFVRPKPMFTEMVEHKGEQVPRFKRLTDKESEEYLLRDLFQEITDSILGTNDK